jgi:hypothetical protein
MNLNRRSGKIYWHSEVGDNDEELPDDIERRNTFQFRTREKSNLDVVLCLDFRR